MKSKNKNDIIKSIIKIQPSGKGIIEYKNEDYKIDRKKINKALDKDIVLIKILKRKNKNKAEVIKIIERSNQKYLGILEKGNKYGFVITKNKNIYTDFFIEKNNLNKYKNEEKVLVKFKYWNNNEESPTGEIIESIGKAGETNTEIHSILHEYGLPYKFEKEILKEATNVKGEISKKEIKNRKDYRKKLTFTIDPRDAKDFDDAISFEQIDDNKFEIGIHIADVTHYVKPNTNIDKEAKNRGNSTYLVDRVIPMLPEKLSNNICSLRPNENKLCFSFIVILNYEGKIIKGKFEKTIINSNYRFAYEEIQEIIENKTKKVSKKNSLTGKEYEVNEKVYKSVITLNKLAKKLRKKRIKKGAINFDKQELKFILDKSNKPINIFFKESKESHKLIEEYMLIANKYLGELIKKTRREFVYRVHDRPDKEKLENLKIIVEKLGYNLKTEDNKFGESLNTLLNKIKGKKEQNLIDKLALRSMSKAEYSNKNIGHYGLCFENYTHFTSPIRRYSDIITHRILEQEINNKHNHKNNLENICKHISKMEQISVKAERASNKFMQVLYMNDKIGNRYKGIISGVTERGIYVEIIENKCEGMINVKNMIGDYYIYEDKTHSLIGERTKRRFQLGDVVYIRVKRANVLKRHLDFQLLK